LTKNLNAKKEYLLQNQELFGKEIFLDIAQQSSPFPNQLNTFEKNICNCEKCDLHKSRTNFVFGEGDKNASLLLIGEAPGAQEDLEGRPFVGRSGKLLDKILKAIDRDRFNDTYICNILKCRPPENRNPSSSEVDKCKPYLNHQIKLVNPKLIVTLGLVATSTLLGKDSSLKDMRNNIFYYMNYPVIVTYHPAFLLRSPSFKRNAWEDFKKIRDYIKN
jgi:DNA polymerase|tara:strand:- start:519 stop:1172 length:654 start_codon:yes stop_codon:yes gene_type:complete